MVKSVDELKKIIKNEMVLNGGGFKMDLNRAANNILRIDNRLVSWGSFRDILANGEYVLEDKNGKKIMDNKKRNWGGARVAGPGKKVGGPKKNPMDKKKPTSVSMSDNTRDILDDLCKKYGKKRSELLEMLILEKSEE